MPAAQFGIGIPVGKKFGVLTEAGIKYMPSFYEYEADTSFGNMSGFKTRLELRYRIVKELRSRSDLRRPQRNYYLAANITWQNEQHVHALSYFYRKDSGQRRSDNYTAHRKVVGFNFLIGEEKAVNERFGLDYYIGVGAKFRSVSTKHLEADFFGDQLDTGFDFNVYNHISAIDVKGGRSVAPNITLGLRLSFRL